MSRFCISSSSAFPFRQRSLFVSLSLLPCLLLPASNALADPADYYLSGSGFYLGTDPDRNAEEPSMGWQINPGMRLHENWWLEGHGFGATLERGDGMGTDFYQHGLGADIQYAFGNRDELTPYVLLGAGFSHNDVVPDAQDDWDYFANLGVGVTHQFFDFDILRWRLEARAVYDNYMSGYIDYRIAAGLEISLRRAVPQEPRVVVKEVVREVVREVPAPVAVVAPRPVTDADLDKDGVINERDRCPDTPRGAKVNGDGCVVDQTLTMRDVTFETNSSRLTMNGQRLMDGVVAFLRAEPAVTATIEGHTDNKGADAYNLKLSQARAASVRSYLVQEGIAAKRLEAMGYGEARPMASNDTDAGREANRRVEFIIRQSR